MSRSVKAPEVRLVMPWPPSVNGYWRAHGVLSHRGGKPRVIVSQILSEKGRDYRRSAAEAVLIQGSPQIAGRVRVTESFFPPSRREYDIDNFRKAYRDALTHSGVIEDDQMIDSDLGNKCRPDKANPRIEIVIQAITNDWRV